MNEILLQFYNNKPEFDAVHSFLTDTVKKLALEHLFEGKDSEAKACAQAKQVVDKAFS